ncbi:MAG: cell division ATP-binding protein FtsE [Oscillospiraceae bacterium]
MIKFTGVTKIYKNTKTTALDDINFEIKDGEFAFIIGASGAGKSTLVKLIMNEESPTHGDIVVNGFELNNLKNRLVPYLRRSMGVVYQDFKLLPQKTVFENVSFAMEAIGKSKAEIEDKVPKLLGLVNLAQKAKLYPDQLSGGEQQRVSLARAFANNPPIIIADEPTGNLDPKTSKEIMYMLEDINKRGTTVIVATHAKELVDELRKRVIVLDGGRLVRDEKAGAYGDV